MPAPTSRFDRDRKSSTAGAGTASGPLPSWIDSFITTNPTFQMMTRDGVNWIDPYTGSIVPAPFDHQRVARAWLAQHQPWRQGPPKRSEELEHLRWHHYLRASMEFARQLRVVRDGAWLNPYSGQWQRGLRLEHGKITLTTLEDLATVLCQCPEAAAGRFLSDATLDVIIANGPTSVPRQARTSSSRLRASSPGTGRHSIDAVDKRELKLAAGEMANVLPKPPRLDGYQLVVHYELHAVRSRDFYHVIDLGGQRLLLTVGTITGAPDTTAAAVAVMAELRAFAHESQTVDQVLVRLNAAVRPRVATGLAVALVAAQLDLNTRQLTVFAADHPGVVLFGRRTPAIELAPRAPTLGEQPSAEYRQNLQAVRRVLNPGDVVILSSLGIHTVRNSAGEMIERSSLYDVWQHGLDWPLGDLVETTCQQVRDFTSRRVGADLAFLALRVKDPEQQIATQEFTNSWLGQME